jgi:hypothetical protein
VLPYQDSWREPPSEKFYSGCVAAANSLPGPLPRLQRAVEGSALIVQNASLFFLIQHKNATKPGTSCGSTESIQRVIRHGAACTIYRNTRSQPNPAVAAACHETVRSLSLDCRWLPGVDFRTNYAMLEKVSPKPVDNFSRQLLSLTKWKYFSLRYVDSFIHL